MGHLLGQCVADRPLQCLQTGVERETFENGKGKEVNEAEAEDGASGFCEHVQMQILRI